MSTGLTIYADSSRSISKNNVRGAGVNKFNITDIKIIIATMVQTHKIDDVLIIRLNSVL